MFDNIGKDLDEEANRRRAASLFITVLGLGGVGGVVLGITAWTAAQVIENSEVVADMVELIEEEIQMDDAPPPPPPPPPPPAAADASEEETEEDPTPDDMVEDVQELKEEVKEEMKSDVKPAGVEGGVEGGVVGGVVGGVQGGIVGGVLGGQLGGGGVTVHQTDLQPKKRFTPEYPEAARALNLGDQKCLVKVFIDEEGVPYNAEVQQCPKVFEDNAREGILKWRWWPYKVDGKKVKVQTTIAFVYKM